MNATVERTAHDIHRDAEFFCKFGGDKDAAIERGGRRLDGRSVDVEAVRKRIHADEERASDRLSLHGRGVR